MSRPKKTVSLIYKLPKMKIISTLVLTISILLLLHLFRSYALMPIPLMQRLGYCLLTQIVLAINVLMLFMVWVNDCETRILGYHPGKVWLRTVITLVPSLFITFFLTPDWLVTTSWSQIGMTNIYIVWFFGLQYGYKKWQDMIELEDNRIRRIFCGKITRITGRNVNVINKNGFVVEIKPMTEPGTRGTCFRCRRKDQTSNDLVLKLIDTDTWNWNRTCGQGLSWSDRSEKFRKGELTYSSFKDKLMQLNHQSIVKYEAIFDFHFRDNPIFLVTPMADMNLDQFMTQHKPLGVSEKWAHRWTRHLCNGLQYLHTNSLTHWNIKPENVLLYRNDKYDQQLLDEELFEENEYLMHWFDLKLTDAGFEYYMPMNGKVVTKKKPSLKISPTDKRDGKAHDIYMVSIIILILMNGDILYLAKKLKDQEENQNREWLETGIDPTDRLPFDSTPSIPESVRFQEILFQERNIYVNFRERILSNQEQIRSTKAFDKFENLAPMTKPLKELIRFMMTNQVRSDISRVMHHSWYELGPKY